MTDRPKPSQGRNTIRKQFSLWPEDYDILDRYKASLPMRQRNDSEALRGLLRDWDARNPQPTRRKPKGEK